MSDDDAHRTDYHAVLARGASQPALSGARLLAEKTWGMLRGLGVERGRLLVSGTDSAVFAGHPNPEGVGSGEFVGTIPPPAWPHQNLSLTRHTPWSPGPNDVVIANLPYADLRAQHRDNARTLLDLQNRVILKAISHTAPGGMTVTVASHQVLDAPDGKHRRMMLAAADLVGAARLPTGLLHPDGGQSSPTDLLVFRRRADGEPMRTLPFMFVDAVPVKDTALVMNEYFEMLPEHVVGTLGHTTDHGQSRLTVTCDDEPVDDVLRTVLSRIAASGQARGLTATSTSSNPPNSRFAPHADQARPQRRLHVVPTPADAFRPQAEPSGPASGPDLA